MIELRRDFALTIAERIGIQNADRLTDDELSTMLASRACTMRAFGTGKADADSIQLVRDHLGDAIAALRCCDRVGATLALAQAVLTARGDDPAVAGLCHRVAVEAAPRTTVVGL